MQEFYLCEVLGRAVEPLYSAIMTQDMYGRHRIRCGANVIMVKVLWGPSILGQMDYTVRPCWLWPSLWIQVINLHCVMCGICQLNNVTTWKSCELNLLQYTNSRRWSLPAHTFEVLTYWTTKGLPFLMHGIRHLLVSSQFIIARLNIVHNQLMQVPLS